MSTAGQVYDSSELDRVKTWLKTQKEYFVENEKSQNQKEWLIIGAITIVSAVVLLLVVKKIS